MDLFFPIPRSLPFRKDPTPYLASFWCFGLILGAVTAAHAGDSHFLLMRRAAYGPVSIVRLYFVMLLPLLFSAVAVFISQPWLVFGICFGKAFLYSLTCFAVVAGFGASGWLVQLLLIFSDTVMLPVLWLFWLRSFRQDSVAQTWQFLLSASVCFLIGSFDTAVIAPFMEKISSL